MLREPDDGVIGGIDFGVAGASARREYARRRKNREQRLQKEHPVIGGALIALGPPAHERAWATGAAGEEATAAYLASRCPRAHVLHDRRMPETRVNIDHIVVAPAGVIVVDTKRYKGRRIRVDRPLVGRPRLTVDGWDKSNLVDGLLRQLRTVETAVARLGVEAPVTAAFCFIDAQLPLIGTPELRGVPILGRRGLVKRVNRDGPLSVEAIEALTVGLSRALPPA